MKRIYMLSILFVCLFLNGVQAQNPDQCVHCKMTIEDNLHRASAEKNEEIIQFDAIECLINYLKVTNESLVSSMKVSDYNTGELIDAETAIYLKSKSIPSPMGANLSAFKTKDIAKDVKSRKGGEIYSWEEIKLKFKTSKFGALDHTHHDHNRPDAHAPIGVMGDHLHQKGGLMVSFRYMNMVMDGNKFGTSDISNNEIYNSFMVAPQDMTMDMYMLGVMYAPSNKLTLMLMQNYVTKSMDLTARMMMNEMVMFRDFSTSSSGFGDLKINAMYGLFNNHKTALHLNAGINIPIGGIKNRDDTPMSDNMKLPYAMQLGSGTFDMTLGATLKGNYTNTSWGTQFLSIFRIGENSEDYRFGNLYQLNIWGAYKLSDNFSISARVLGLTEGNIEGMDTELNPMMVTTASTANYGSDKIKTFLGVNVSFPETSSLKNFRLGLEAGGPVYEDYNGIQMNENLNLNFGLKYTVL
ncbi:nitrous oxide reductase accessory protein NosL [Psychroserpens luteolus]|uniref:nitrous oxide reductase accessory protein NosL n=1 Tax=Psychroserpens luteolus TaxID=2855840 RepID=UPI001E2E09B5|nr:nitrous oxide reductase accessory protein NosL [Psychroserpens luteolus]MCD2259877.1 nitrous oxide reductase accessory protein NosL [Psychroserpens luteolus]